MPAAAGAAAGGGRGAAAAQVPAMLPSKGPMAVGCAALVILVLSALWTCRAVPPPELGQQHGVQWGLSKQAQAEPLLPSRRRRDDDGQQPTATTLEHSHPATMLPSSNQTDALVPLPALSTNASLQQGLLVQGENHSPEPDLLLSSVPPTAPSTSLQRVLVVPTTTDLQDETDSPEPDLMPPTAPSTNASLQQALMVSTTTDLQDETDSPESDLLLSSVPPPAPGSSTSLQQKLAVPTTMDPEDKTDSPDPDLLLGPAPSTQAAPGKSFTTILGFTLPNKEGTAGSHTDSSSTASPALGATTPGDKVKKPKPPRTATPSAPWHTQPEATTEPTFWGSGRVLGKCLLVVVLLALVATTFMVCTGVLSILLWRRARSARHRLSHTEMLCISSLLPDSEVPANGSGAAPAQSPKLLLNGGSEADCDNLTLSSFLPDRC